MVELNKKIKSLKNQLLGLKTSNPTGGDSAKLFSKYISLTAPNGQTGQYTSSSMRRWNIYLQDLSDKKRGIFYPTGTGGAAAYRFEQQNWVQPYVVSVYGVLGQPDSFRVTITVNPYTTPKDQPGVQIYGADKFEISSVQQQ